MNAAAIAAAAAAGAAVAIASSSGGHAPVHRQSTGCDRACAAHILSEKNVSSPTVRQSTAPPPAFLRGYRRPGPQWRRPWVNANLEAPERSVSLNMPPPAATTAASSSSTASTTSTTSTTSAPRTAAQRHASAMTGVATKCARQEITKATCSKDGFPFG